jgi:hypothetical protein
VCRDIQIVYGPTLGNFTSNVTSQICYYTRIFLAYVALQIENAVEPDTFSFVTLPKLGSVVFKSLTSSQPLKYKNIIAAKPYFQRILCNAENSI